MADNTTNDGNDTETVDAASIGKGNNPISRATLGMVAAVIIFVIIAAVIFTKFFSAPTGTGGANPSGAASRSNQ